MGTRSSIPLVVAKFAAVTAALVALTWFVVAEQRRANPARPLAPVGDATAASEAVLLLDTPPPVESADPAVFLPSSKSFPIDSMSGADEAVFLFSSKSVVVEPFERAPGEEFAEPVFLPNSKTRLLDARLLPPVLQPGTAPVPEPRSDPRPEPHRP